jgi:hypothetical protein
MLRCFSFRKKQIDKPYVARKYIPQNVYEETSLNTMNLIVSIFRSGKESIIICTPMSDPTPVSCVQLNEHELRCTLHCSSLGTQYILQHSAEHKGIRVRVCKPRSDVSEQRPEHFTWLDVQGKLVSGDTIHFFYDHV